MKKALTLWEPYAMLWVSGFKIVETRPRRTHFRGTLWVHAAVKEIHNLMELGPLTAERIKAFHDAGMVDAIGNIRPLPLGAVVGCVNIVDCVPIEELYGTRYDTPNEREYGDWSPGRFGWIADSPKHIVPPIPAKGAQGLWNWEPPTDSMVNDLCRLVRPYREEVQDGHLLI